MAMSSRETCLVAATIVTSGPTSSWTRAYRARTSSTDKANDALGATGLSGSPLGEEQILVARGAEIHPLDARHSRLEHRLLGRAPEVEFSVGDDARPEAFAKRTGDVLPHLVAAGADCRPDDRGLATADRPGGRFDNAVQQPAPARMQHRERRLVPVHPRERNEDAIRAEDEHREPPLVRPETVTGGPARACLSSVDDDRVVLEAERQPLLVGPELLTEHSPILVHAFADVSV